MFARFRPRLTYANVVASLALFVALGGGAYAAGLVGKNGKIKSCVAKANGALRVVRPNAACDKSERTLTWNQRGRPGRDATPATFAAEATHPVAPYNHSLECHAHPGRFCGAPPNDSTHVWSWANYGHGYAPVGYWRDKTGIVHLEGMLSPVFGNTIGDVAFVLPVGYRPFKTREFPSRMCESSTPASDSYVDINSQGEVLPGDDFGVCASLDGVNFRP